MSIVINVSIDAKESTKAREPCNQLSKIKSSVDIGKIQNFQYFQSYPNINSNYEEDFLTLSDKSIINLPKYLRANSNDLNKINIVFGGNFDDNKVLSKMGTGTIDFKASTNDREENSSKNDRDVFDSDIRINNSSFISTISERKNYSIKDRNLYISSFGRDKEILDNRNTQQTFNEKNVYDEINRAEAEKCVEHMENLNNLSNIIKNKNSIYPRISRNMSSENLFLYKNIVESTYHKSRLKNEQNIIRYGLNNGFILDDQNNPYSGSQNSIRSINIHNSEESRKNINTAGITLTNTLPNTLNNNDQTRGDKKIYQINKKLENIKHNYNTYSTGNGSGSGTITSNCKNYESYSSTNSIKDEKDRGVELTCFQKLCGKK